MKILLSVFACAPNVGSEGGVGWRWALELSKDNEVCVVTDVTRKSAIETALSGISRPRLKFVYFRPTWLKWIPLNSRTAQILYVLWQFSLPSLAKKLHRENNFDYVHHLTYGVFRHPSLLWTLGVPLIFGPVGGGETSPMALRHSMTTKGKITEFMRDIFNKCARFDPFLRRCLSEATLIFARTRETRDALPRFARAKTILQQEIGGYDARRSINDLSPRTNRPFRVLYAGRLLEWKGIHLAIHAFAGLMDALPDCEFVIVGSGPMSDSLKALAKSLNVYTHVKFIPLVPQEDLFAMMSSYDCLLFPSLHDSGGNVVLEALSFGLPVICLDLGGPPTFINGSCGRVVCVDRMNEKQVVNHLTSALIELASCPSLVTELSKGALKRAKEITWENQIQRTMKIIVDKVSEKIY